jgi:hypothetical protein
MQRQPDRYYQEEKFFSLHLPISWNEEFPAVLKYCDNVEKHGRARQATDDHMAHALCMLDN